jgi:hypothetical protein
VIIPQPRPRDRKAIAEDRPAEPGFDTGLENQKVLEAVMKSVASDRWTDVV